MRLLPHLLADLPATDTVALVPSSMEEDSVAESASSSVLFFKNMQEVDYLHRGDGLAKFPFYFYVAAVTRRSISRILPPALVVPFASSHPQSRQQVQKVSVPWLVPHLVGRRRPVPSVDKMQSCVL